MTDMIEAVARAICRAQAEAKRHVGACTKEERVAYFTEHYWKERVPLAQAAIAAHTKALVDGAGELCERLAEQMCNRRSEDLCGCHLCAALTEAAATIAALLAENERAKLEGVRAGIEASAKKTRDTMIAELSGLSMESQYRAGIKWCGERCRDAIRALDAEAIARRDSALSDLIAGDADLIDGGK